MSDSNVQALALLIGPVAATFASLPLPLVQRIFLALPPDSRGRACCVCRAWRDVLAEPSLWTRLDMSDVDAERQRFLGVLRAAGRHDRPPACRRVASHSEPPNRADADAPPAARSHHPAGDSAARHADDRQTRPHM